MKVARIASCLNRPDSLIFLPPALLAALSFGGEAALVPLAVVLLAVLAVRRRSWRTTDSPPASDQVVSALDAALAEGAAAAGRASGWAVGVRADMGRFDGRLR